MGMDVYGRTPDSAAGKYFRTSMGWWGRLWWYCGQVAPQLTGKVEYGFSNDGDGLDSGDAAELGRLLVEQLQDGRTAAYEQALRVEVEAIPDETCDLCGGSGVRRDQVGIDMGMVERGWCNGCNGNGSRRPFHAYVGFDTDTVAEFAQFLQHCGGFNIW